MTTAKSKPGAKLGDAVHLNGTPSRRNYLRPRDAGRDMSLEDFENADGQEGWTYELIDGRIEVSPTPELPHDSILSWLNRCFVKYSESHPEVINYISNHGRVYIPDRPAPTCPQPDFAVFHNFPLDVPRRQRRWEDVSPILVVETISPRYRNKDLIRNVELYLQSPTIREYWVFDPQADDDEWVLRVYRKHGRSWQKPIDLPAGATYTTRLLPDFALVIDPDA